MDVEPADLRQSTKDQSERYQQDGSELVLTLPPLDYQLTVSLLLCALTLISGSVEQMSASTRVMLASMTLLHDACTTRACLLCERLWLACSCTNALLLCVSGCSSRL